MDDHFRCFNKCEATEDMEATARPSAPTDRAH
jgi:hypothetical protein